MLETSRVEAPDIRYTQSGDVSAEAREHLLALPCHDHLRSHQRGETRNGLPGRPGGREEVGLRLIVQQP